MNEPHLTLGTPPGIVLEVLPHGATVHRLVVTGGDGERRNVVLGHASVSQRLRSPYYLGGTIGRYANRIAGGRFTLDEHVWEVDRNEGNNCLHGGSTGFDRREWEVICADASSATLALASPHGEMGFPGSLDVTAEFIVTADEVSITYEATTDSPTVVNLTNHAYFNLDGVGTGTVDDHTLQVAAAMVTPVTSDGIPTGELAPVAGTDLDLRMPTRIGTLVRSPHPWVVAAGGIDHNFVLDPHPDAVAAILESRRSRTRLILETDQPGLQVYTGNAFDGSVMSAEGMPLRQGDGIALEPQLFPDSPNHPEWPSARLDPGQTYRTSIRWRFQAVP